MVGILKDIGWPSPEEYGIHSKKYIDLLDREKPVLVQLHDSASEIIALYKDIDAEKLFFRYAPNKWNLKEVLVHLIDDERIYAYRSLCFARNEKKRLPGFDQDAYNLYSEANHRYLEEILEEYRLQRAATLVLFQGFSKLALERIGSTTEFSASVRAMACHITGHELHHLHIIKKKYLS